MPTTHPSASLRLLYLDCFPSIPYLAKQYSSSRYSSILYLMHVDSHRLRFHPDPTITTTTAPTSTLQPHSYPPNYNDPTATMPCSARYAAALEETELTPDGIKMYTWRAVRRQQLRKLRQPVRWIVLFMALLEIACVSNVFDLVYQGRHGSKAPGPEDYGVC